MKLIIDGYGKSLHKKDNQLLIKQKEEEIYRIPIKKVSDITIVGKGYVTFDALSLIAQNNIKLIAVNYFGQIEYILQSPSQKDINLKKQQYKASENNKGLKLAKSFIKSKIKNQYSTLKTLNKNKNIPQVKENQRKIKNIMENFDRLAIQNTSDMKNRIMGMEGNCSAYYWNSISFLLPQTINFKKRNQKPQEDVTNSMLNYGYAILASQITENILTKGLDPYCGFLHVDMNKRTSLTYDIIEEFRQQIVDKTVFKLINNNQIDENSIDKRNNSLKFEYRKILASEIMDKLYSTITYNNEKLSYLKIIEKQVIKIVDYLENGENYSGFSLHW